MSADDFEPPEPPSDDEFSDELPDEFTGEHGDAEPKPAVFVTTREPVELTVSQLDDPRAPDSSALAAFISGRMVARSAMPPEAIARLVELHLFDDPVRLGLFAFEEDPGLQCRLFALVPRSSIEANAHDAEPWKASVPSFEAPDDDDDSADEDDDLSSEGDEEEAVPFETILLGHIVRFEKDRRHPEDLAAEAVDVLQRIIHGAESLQDADRKAIDDLLGSL